MGRPAFQKAAAYTVSPSSLAHAWVEHSSSMRGLYYPLWFGRRGYCSIRVRILYLTVIAIANSMGWLLSNLYIVQTRTYIYTHPFCFFGCLSSTNGSLTHSILRYFTVDLQPTRQEA